VIVATEYDFDAAHNLPNYAGKCERLHGHTYRLRVLCEAPVDPSTGLAIDFALVKKVVKERVIEPLDHTYLNETIPIPSAENIAVWIWDRLQGTGLPLREIHVFETAAACDLPRGGGGRGGRRRRAHPDGRPRRLRQRGGASGLGVSSAKIRTTGGRTQARKPASGRCMRAEGMGAPAGRPSVSSIPASGLRRNSVRRKACLTSSDSHRR
jgi:6-pyruvoyltetrahydropterin/6-carboxytetrahydropterin synthase